MQIEYNCLTFFHFNVNVVCRYNYQGKISMEKTKQKKKAKTTLYMPEEIETMLDVKLKT